MSKAFGGFSPFDRGFSPFGGRAIQAGPLSFVSVMPGTTINSITDNGNGTSTIAVSGGPYNDGPWTVNNAALNAGQPQFLSFLAPLGSGTSADPWVPQAPLVALRSDLQAEVAFRWSVGGVLQSQAAQFFNEGLDGVTLEYVLLAGGQQYVSDPLVVRAAPSFTENGVVVNGSSYLQTTQTLPVFRNFVHYFNFTCASTASGRSLQAGISGGIDDMLDALVQSNHNFLLKGTTSQNNNLSNQAGDAGTGLTATDRIGILCGYDIVNGLRWVDITVNGTQVNGETTGMTATATDTFAPTSLSLFATLNGFSRFTGVSYRNALFVDVPDFSAIASPSSFTSFQNTDGTVKIPAQAGLDVGVPARYDFVGNADALNGGEHEGELNAFETVVGTFTDVAA